MHVAMTDIVEPFVALDDDAFKTQLAAVVPQLRAFGRTLSGDRDMADDLVQETLLKAWSARGRFAAGTSIRAWTFIILRNLFLSQLRRDRFRGEWDEGVAERTLLAPASQQSAIHLADLYRGLQQLSAPQREALILIGAGGFSYEEASEICGAAVGTVKSRVARGRAALLAALESNAMPSRRGDPAGEIAFDSIMADLQRFTGS
jgi:RNA polymerase sigma factor (sigma-70 family)